MVGASHRKRRVVMDILDELERQLQEDERNMEQSEWEIVEGRVQREVDRVFKDTQRQIRERADLWRSELVDISEPIASSRGGARDKKSAAKESSSDDDDSARGRPGAGGGF